MVMRVGVQVSILLLGAAVLSGCETLPGEMQHILGVWGGPHAAMHFQGGLADAQFDCASGTLDDPLIPAADGSFSVKGTYRTGAPGPVKVGDFFKSQEAVYSGQVVKGVGKDAPRKMTLIVSFEDGTKVGPFTLTENAPPELTRCL
jgi:hypothetical protein